MFRSAKLFRMQSSLLIVGCLLVAAIGCSDKPKVVDAEAAEGAAGGAAGVGGTRAGNAGSKSAAAVAGKGGSRATVPAADVAGSGDETQTTGAEEAVDSAEENYGWEKFERTPFGEGKTPNSELRRQLKVTIIGDDTTMTGRGYVMRSSLGASYVDVALAITNSNADLLCFIKAESVVWKTADGKVIAGDGHALTYLSGSVGDSDGSPTTTCLGPGEKGYFLEIQSAEPGMDSLFDTLAEVELMLSSSESSFERPEYRVLPLRWKGSTNELEVTFKNLGTASAPIELAQGEYILTDADGLPLTWGFLDVDTGLELLGPGELLVLKSDIYYDGKASNMLVSFGY
jgi:hypothetical protein